MNGLLAQLGGNSDVSRDPSKEGVMATQGKDFQIDKNSTSKDRDGVTLESEALWEQLGGRLHTQGY